MARIFRGTILFLMVAAVVSLVVPMGSAFAAYQRVNSPNAADLMDVHIYRLDNGLTVYLTENHETPRFYAEISVRAGSKNDPSVTTGLAHYLEHLLFKGTRRMGSLDFEKEKPLLDEITELYEQHFREEDAEKRKAIYGRINEVSREAAQYAVANEIDKLYKDMGGSGVNAHTWHEETVYKVSLPANRLAQWATMESERFSDPVFRLFHTELETVYEEKNRSIDNKSRVINYAVNDLLYKSHPYGQQTTIGTVEHLKRPSLKIIREYFETYYVPNNMAISISGDIDIHRTIELIDQHFSFWEAKPVPETPRWAEKPLDGAERVTVKYLGEEYVLLAFRTVPRGHPDVEALMLLDMILDNSVAGLINLNLNQQQKVRAAGSYPTFMNDYGSQQFYGIPKEGQTLKEVEALLLEQVALVRKGEFEEWILDAILTDFKKGQKAQLESDGARVSQMTNSFISGEDWDVTIGQLGRMEAVTKEDVVRVARRYFGDDYVAGYRIDEQHDLPSIEKPQIDPVQIDPSRQSKFAKKVLSLPFVPIDPVYVDPEKDFRYVQLTEGVEVYYSPNPLNDLFSFSVLVEKGSHEDNTISIATRLLDKSGAGDLSAEDLKKEWYKIGCDFGVGAGDNQSSIRISGLDENFERALGLMLDVVRRPTADAATLVELKSIILQQREDAKKDPRSIGSALTNYHRYGKDSFYLRMLPSTSFDGLSVDGLHASIRDLLKYEQTITYTGSLPFDEFIAILKRVYPLEDAVKDPPPYRFLYSAQADDTQIYFFDKEMAQAQVRIEFPDGRFDEQFNAGVQLYNSYFAGGMSGIVFQELREARALAYSAAARYASGTRTDAENIMIGVIGCQADKTLDAVGAFLDLFDNLPESPERFTEAVNSISNRYRTSTIGFRSVIGAVRSWKRLGLEVDPRRERFAHIQEAELDGLMAFHKAHVAGRPKLISIVGDKSKVDLDGLAKFGAITEVGIGDIFVE